MPPSVPPRGAPPPTVLLDTLLELFPDEVLLRFAEQSGFVQRYRKLDPVAFFWAVTLEAGVYLQRSLDQLRIAYNGKAAQPLHSYASFYDRFTPELIEFLRLCVAHGLAQLKAAPGNRLSPKLAAFEDLLIQDTTIVRLSAALATHFPPIRHSVPAAGAKIAALLSVRAHGPLKLSVTAESTNDRDTLTPGPWVKNSILLLDLGFYKHQAFARIAEHGGYYLTRLNALVDPMVVRSLRAYRGPALEGEGRSWKELRPKAPKEILDLQVEIAFSRRAYRGHRSGDLLTARLVAVWNEDARKFHTYLTNLGPEVLSAEEVAQLYGCRWEIELVFKELKSQYALDRVNTKNRSVAEAMIWASLLTLLVSRRTYNAMREGLSGEERARYPPGRWAIAFREQSGRILDVVMKALGKEKVDGEPLLELSRALWARALDPMAGRKKFRDEWWG